MGGRGLHITNINLIIIIIFPGFYSLKSSQHHYQLLCGTKTCTSKLNEVPLRQWIQSRATIKFIGNNLDLLVGVRDIRSDHQKHLHHMFSLLVAKSRIPLPAVSAKPRSLRTLSSASLLPTEADIATVKLNLSVLVSRILCTHIKGLRKFKKVIPNHIMHKYSLIMAQKSDVAVLDVLYKNEACHKDMLDIMKYEQNYLGEDYSGRVGTFWWRSTHM